MWVKNSISIVLIGFFLVACKGQNSSKRKKFLKEKKVSIMREYQQIKEKLEPQGYDISTDSIDRIFIDHAVTINYHK